MSLDGRGGLRTTCGAEQRMVQLMRFSGALLPFVCVFQTSIKDATGDK